MKRVYLFTDLDNTLYNWIDFFAPSFRAMIHALSRKTGINEESLIIEFKKVYSKYGSLEYSFSVQELDIFKALDTNEIDDLIKIAKGAFSRTRKKNLRPYDGVKETLDWIREQRIGIIGVTNSPIFHAYRRLNRLRLDQFFLGLAGSFHKKEIEDKTIHSKLIKEKVKTNAYNSRISDQYRWELNENELKPSPLGYKKIIDDLDVSPQNVYIVGDSLDKDISPALDIGCVGIWARYGTVFNKENFETLLKITPWSSEIIDKAYDFKNISPDYTIDSIIELKDILPKLQLSLF